MIFLIIFDLSWQAIIKAINKHKKAVAIRAIKDRVTHLFFNEKDNIHDLNKDWNRGLNLDIRITTSTL